MGIEPALDRDTAGLAGSPAISDSIFAKIALSDVFIADVTIVNPRTKGRLTPNPNVLVELGFAASILGWDRILLVQNTAFGLPEKLPFDLRGRRIVGYDAKLGEKNCAEVRKILQGRLEIALKSALSASMSVGTFAGPDVPIWWGSWRIPDRGSTYGGNLEIREVGSAGFVFDIYVHSGAHIGQMSGFARFVSADHAYARIAGASSEQVCELSFRRYIKEGRREIEVTETSPCFYYHGMAITFDGIFVRKMEWLFERGMLDEIDLQRLYSITGQYYEPLTTRFQTLGEVKNLDRFKAKVFAGGVTGMFTSMAGILMRGDAGQLWVAYIDDDSIRYFTTERSYNTKLPLTIEHWRDGHKGKVIFDSEVDRIPKAIP